MTAWEQEHGRAEGGAGGLRVAGGVRGRAGGRGHGRDASVSCFVAANEYITRTAWQVEVRLAPDADAFETRTTWMNTSNLPQPYYHWMNATYGVRGNPKLVFPGTAAIGHEGEPIPAPADAASCVPPAVPATGTHAAAVALTETIRMRLGLVAARPKGSYRSNAPSHGLPIQTAGGVTPRSAATVAPTS